MNFGESTFYNLLMRAFSSRVPLHKPTDASTGSQSWDSSPDNLDCVDVCEVA